MATLELTLALLTLASGGILLGNWLLARQRRRSLEEGDGEMPFSSSLRRTLVEYSRAFFPVLLLVFIVRSFLFEPFRIPSKSMIPTLLVGDFVLVNKFSYGVRLPFTHNRVIGNRVPQRGDVAVFLYPLDRRTPYIKRVIGLPGDRLMYRDKQLYVNGERIHAEDTSRSMEGARVLREHLPNAVHEILVDLRRPSRGFDNVVLTAHCPRSRDYDGVVPEGHYFMLGDNRDDSQDSRCWGFVPDEYLLGRASLIWMNWDRGVSWARIGTAI